MKKKKTSLFSAAVYALSSHLQNSFNNAMPHSYKNDWYSNDISGLLTLHPVC